MYSSEEDDGQSSRYLNRHVFLKLLSQNPVVVDDSTTPTTFYAKKAAWNIITNEYALETGQRVPSKRLMTFLTDLKTSLFVKELRINSDLSVFFKDWQEDLQKILAQEENPVFKTIRNRDSAGSNEIQTSGNNNVDIAQKTTSQNMTTQIEKEKDETGMQYETDETKDMTTAQLQRAVLLQKLELQRIQIEKEKILLQNLKNDVTMDQSGSLIPKIEEHSEEQRTPRKRTKKSK